MYFCPTNTKASFLDIFLDAAETGNRPSQNGRGAPSSPQLLVPGDGRRQRRRRRGGREQGALQDETLQGPVFFFLPQSVQGRRRPSTFKK